jgi:HMG (high mobility group) box
MAPNDYSDEEDDLEEDVDEEEEEEEEVAVAPKRKTKKWKVRKGLHVGLFRSNQHQWEARCLTLSIVACSQDPNRPKRAMSAFFLYSQGNRSRVKEENPEASFGEVVSAR